LGVPRIAEFYGIVIGMLYNDHEPPHFHVTYGGSRALVVGRDPSEWIGRELAASADAPAADAGCAAGVRLPMTIETVVSVRAERPYVLDVTFSDGTRRRVDLEGLLYGEMFGPLRDPDRFAEVAVDLTLGTVYWPNGADVSPEFLYSDGSVTSIEEEESPHSVNKMQ
jgi:hypothetical protein